MTRRIRSHFGSSISDHPVGNVEGTSPFEVGSRLKSHSAQQSALELVPLLSLSHQA